MCFNELCTVVKCISGGLRLSFLSASRLFLGTLVHILPFEGLIAGQRFFI